MIFIDTHTHLYLDSFDDDRDLMISRAQEAGVVKFLLPNIDIDSTGAMLDLVSRYPGICYPMAGLHPTSAKEDFRDQLKEVDNLRRSAAIVGIGEVGFDRYWDKGYDAVQREALKTQIEWSLEMGLPLSVHIRDAFSEVFEVLSLFGKTMFRGVFHCFTGGEEEAEKAIGYGFHLGIGGIITFKNTPLQKVLQGVSPDRVVLESDAPFLAPVPYRGKRNEPAYLTYTASKLAEIWGITVNRVAEATTANAEALFNLS